MRCVPRSRQRLHPCAFLKPKTPRSHTTKADLTPKRVCPITIPRQFRDLCACVFLCAFASYQAAAFVDHQPWFQPNLRAPFGDTHIYWPARWKMFTPLDRTHTNLEFVGFIDGDWTHLPMDEWYPGRWVSGYRWERPAVAKWRTLQIPFLNAACSKSSATRVRLLRHSWRKVLGESEQPIEKPKTKVLRELDCGRPYRAAKGRVL